MTTEQLQRVASSYFIWDSLGGYGRSVFRRTYGAPLTPDSPVGWWLSCLLFIDKQGDYNRDHTWPQVWEAVHRLATASGDWPE